MRRRVAREAAEMMPEPLRAQPTVDDPIDVWRGWWSARDEWRKATGAPNVLGAWIKDVSLLMRLQNERWVAGGRALARAAEDAGSEWERDSR